VIEHRGEAIFLPGDPPRRGALALFAPVPPRGPGRRAELTVAVRTGTVVWRTTLDARVVPIAEALGWLAGLPADSDLPASLAAWSVAVKAALGLVARGRLLPAISPGGFDAWRVGPLDPADEEWLSRLAAALPLQAHALPIEGSRPLRVRSAASLLRDCWDAVADCLARSPAAPRLTAHPAFAGQRRVGVGGMREWLAAATQPRQESARPGLRLVPPPQPEQPFSAVLQLRSHADPSLVVDAADLWRAPSAVLRRFGDTVESELLLALRRGTRILLLRGRSREQALAGLRGLRGEGSGAVTAPPASAEPTVDPGVEARTLLAQEATAALPAPPPPPPRPGLPASLAVDPPAGARVRGEDLRALAADAARRAWELAHGTGDGGLDLSVQADLARLAAQRLGGSGFDELAIRAGARPRTLMRAALAWHLGGRAAFEVLDGPGWQPPADVVEEGRAALAAAFGRAAVRGERVTDHGVGMQLRYGRDELWYVLEKRSGAWELHHPPDVDPRRLVALVAPATAGTADASSDGG
jgi:hypothetical protein